MGGMGTGEGGLEGVDRRECGVLRRSRCMGLEVDGGGGQRRLGAVAGGRDGWDGRATTLGMGERILGGRPAISEQVRRTNM